MDKKQAINWLVDNIVTWPVSTEGAPYTAEWCFSNDLMFESMGNPKECIKISITDWIAVKSQQDK